MNEIRLNPQHRVCPMEKADSLEKGWRKYLHKPEKILKPYIKQGMTVLDMGCGPGFFTIPLSKLVGSSGKVIAADLQPGMLDKVKAKIDGTDLAQRIELRLTPPDSIGITTPVDFVLVFYLLHELPDQLKFLKEVKFLLKPGGRVFIAEPTFHVSKKDFASSVELMTHAGFTVIKRPFVWFSRAVALE